MAEVPFRPVRQLSEYKGKEASASREFQQWVWEFFLNNHMYMYVIFSWCSYTVLLIFTIGMSLQQIIHFNFNLMQDTKKNANGSEQVQVIYPKFKNGEASIRDITIEQNFGKKL